MMKGSHWASHQVYLGRAFVSALRFGDLNSLLLFRDHVWANFGPMIFAKLKVPKMISMSSNSFQGPNYIISNVLGCVLIISDDACDVWEMLEVLIFRPVWLDSRIIFCQEIASHPIRGSAEKYSSIWVAAINECRRVGPYDCVV